MTFYTSLEGDARRAYEDSIGVVWAEAQRQLSLDEEALVLRDLLASQDMSLASETWSLPIVSTTGFTTWIDTTIDDTRFIAVYGFSVPNFGFSSNSTAPDAGAELAGVTVLRVTRGGKTLRLWQVEPYTKSAGDTSNGSSNDIRTLYADDPVTVFQNIPFKVEIFSPSTAPFTTATPVLPLLGKVAEPEGKTINR